MANQKCIKCGKSGMLLKVNSDGLCETCYGTLRIQIQGELDYLQKDLNEISSCEMDVIKRIYVNSAIATCGRLLQSNQYSFFPSSLYDVLISLISMKKGLDAK